eukprot:10178567-Heterocapsa_arctica.AAC.1
MGGYRNDADDYHGDYHDNHPAGYWLNWAWTTQDGWHCVGTGLGHYQPGAPGLCAVLGWGLCACLAVQLWMARQAQCSGWAP